MHSHDMHSQHTHYVFILIKHDENKHKELPVIFIAEYVLQLLSFENSFKFFAQKTKLILFFAYTRSLILLPVSCYFLFNYLRNIYSKSPIIIMRGTKSITVKFKYRKKKTHTKHSILFCFTNPEASLNMTQSNTHSNQLLFQLIFYKVLLNLLCWIRHEINMNI